MKISVESDYRNKILYISFPEPCSITKTSDVLQWRSQWTQALKSWHSPYKALIDCTNLTVTPTEDLEKSFSTMMAFLKGFFLKKAIGFGLNEKSGHEHLPFEVLKTIEEASEKIGVRAKKASKGDDFRSLIQFDNHFKQHVVEVSFSKIVDFDSKDKVLIFKNKLMNNLMHWHSSWNLLIDCSNATFNEECRKEFSAIEKAFKGFFLKRTVGYMPKEPGLEYPFPIYRSRHRATAILESEGLFSGEDADCQSRKSGTEG